MHISHFFSEPVDAAKPDLPQEENLRPVKRKSLQKCFALSQELFLCPSAAHVFCSFLLIDLHNVFCLKILKETIIKCVVPDTCQKTLQAKLLQD